jgi:UDP-N-acetylmuramoyl-L-alanyl-D-glutamate--2,6-diaminopimelate ligase
MASGFFYLPSPVSLNALLAALRVDKHPQADVTPTLLTPAAFDTHSAHQVQQVTSDSRQVDGGGIFVALAGSHVDGHLYIAQAVAAGASAIVLDMARKDAVIQSLPQDVQTAIANNAPNAPVLIGVPHTYRTLALLGSALYGQPGRKMMMVGVTGTNGKTTVTHLIEQILIAHGRNVGLIGTLGAKLGGANPTTSDKANYADTGNTTPMAMDLESLLGRMLASGKDSVVMEVSSHALDQHRAAGCDFRAAVITNLTQDHLDYHTTMDQYAQAKAKLFSGLDASAGNRVAVINLDDAYAQTFLEAVPAGVTTATYSIDSPQGVYRATGLGFDIYGAKFTLVCPDGSYPVALKIAGKFNIYNALAALACSHQLGVPMATCIKAIGQVEGVRGRFEVVATEPAVLVDYAHTPDGLQNVLEAARAVVPEGGRLIAVFGCGGDRDATKRPKMGRIVEQLSDLMVITSDNPRSEDPQRIITDILAGIRTFLPDRMVVNADREQAIHQAIDLARPNDVVVIAGKGHEDYQILADRTIHFDDKEVVQAYWPKRKSIPAAGSV